MAKILICDDSQFMRNVVRDILNKTKHELSEVENGKQVIEFCASEKPDLLLLDIIMPEMDGIDVLKELDKDIKVIIVSAVGQDKMVDEAKALGALDYIVKPFDEKDLLAKVSSVLGE
jgi:CheY-like chemotaxis protein